MYLMTCTRPDLAYPLSILARYVAPGRHRPEHMAATKRRSSQGYTFSLGSGSVSWLSTRSSSVLGSSCEAEIYAGAMAAQELRWLTYLLTDLGEQPRSPPVLYVDNKAMLALCREHRLENRSKHIALRYFLARELQQRGQLHLAYVASQANTADIFTKALPPGDHQRFCTMLACFALLDWSCFPTCTQLILSSLLHSCFFTPHPQTQHLEQHLSRQLPEQAHYEGEGLPETHPREQDPGVGGGLPEVDREQGRAAGAGEGQSGRGRDSRRDRLVECDVLRREDTARGGVVKLPAKRIRDKGKEDSSSRRCFARLDDAWRTEFGDDVERPRWAELLRSGVAIFDLDFAVIIYAMYALSFSAEGDCYWCVPPDPGIVATALVASASGTPPGTAPAEALHTFTLDSGASRCFFRDSTTLIPLPAPVPVRLADPSGGLVIASSSTVLPCPAVPSGSLSGLHLPSFSTNLVSTAALQDAMVTTTTPGGQRVSICTCTRTGRHLATFTRRLGSSLYTLATEPPLVDASTQVSVSGQVAASCSCRLLSHQNLLWHHRLGHLSLPRLQGMHSRLLVFGLPRSLPPLPPLPAPPCLPCVKGRQRAAPHSSSFPPTTAPLQTLHMDVWGPARVSGQGRERYFLLVVDDYTRYTTVFPLCSKDEVSAVLIPWIRTVRLQLRERFGQDLPVLRLHSDRGGEFSSDLLRDFCRGEGITQSFTLLDSPQQNGIAERRIGLVMEGPAPSGVSQVDPLPGTAPVQVAVVSGAAPSAASGGAVSGGAETGGVGSEGAGCRSAKPEGVEHGGAESEGAEPEGAESEGAKSGGAEPRGTASSGGPGGASPRLSSQQLCEWLVQCAHRRSGAPGAGEPGGAGAGGAAVTTGVGDPTEPGAAGGGGAGAGVAGVGGPGASGAGGAGGGAVDPGAGGAGGTVRPCPYFSQPPLQPASPLPVPSPYTEQSKGLTGRREPASRPVSPVRTARRAPRSRPPPVPGTHTMALRLSSVPLRVPLPAPPQSSLPAVFDPESHRARAASPTVARLLATAVTDPSFESAAASALVAELLDFAAACRLVFATADTEALTLVKSELQKRHTCTDLVRRAWGLCLKDGVPLSSLVTQTPLGSSCEAEIFAGAMAAQELRWLTYLLADLGEQPRSPPVLYVDNKAMIALCQEHKLEHRTKHIALQYFLARELQQRGQLRLTYVATWANTADVFTKALPPACFALLLLLTSLVTIACSGYPPLRLWGAHTGIRTRDLRSDTIYNVLTGARARDPTEPGAAGAGGAGAVGVGAGGTGAGGAGVGGAGSVDLGAGAAGGTVQPWPYFVPLLQQVLGVLSSAGLPPPSLCPPLDQSQPLLQPASPLLAPSPYTGQTGGLTERREPASRPASPVRTGRCVPRPRPPPVPSTHAMALRPSSVPLRVPLPPPPESSLPAVPDPKSDRACAASPIVSRLLATVVTDPSSESTAASALDEFESLAAAVPYFASMLLALEGDPDAPDIPTPCSYVEAITGPYSSQWQAAMDAEMASWKSTGTYVDAVPPSWANILDGMWIFRVKRPPGSPPTFKARYVARGFRQRQGVDYFQTFSPTPKMTTLRGSLHEEMWLRRPPGFTGSFPAGTQLSLRRPVYGLGQAPRKWHDTLRTTLVALGFTPSTTDTSLFLRTDTSLLLFYVLVYITRDRARRTFTLTQSHMVHQVLQRFGFQFSSPQPTPLSTGHSLSTPPSDKSVEPSGPYPELVGCLITSGMGLVLRGRGPVVLTGHADASWADDSAMKRSSQGYTFSLGSGSVSWRSTRSSSVLSSSCEAEVYVGAMAAQELRWLTDLLTDLVEQPRSPPVLYVDNKAMIALFQEHRLEHRTKHIALQYFLARELQQRGQLCLAYVATRANTADIFTKALPPGDHQRVSTVLGLVPTLPHLLTA
ncbi:unnamed protein product [Closterium sp. NIES-53]